MNTNDKNYVDRLHNQQVNELNEIKNRLLILEGKPTATPEGNIRGEIDTDKVYEMFLKACHDCLQQRQERHQEEDSQAKERLRQEYESKGEPYYGTDAKMRIAIVKEFNTFYRLIITYIKRTEKKFVDIHMDILKHLGASTVGDDAPKSHSIFSNLPPCFLPKLNTLLHRITNRIRNYLTGNFTVPRGWTLLTILLYSLAFILILCFRITIMVSG